MLLRLLPALVLKTARVFEGEKIHANWSVRLRGNRIEAAGPGVDTAKVRQIQ